jgi:hypothetical protein
MRKQRDRLTLLLIATAINGQSIPDIRDSLEPLTLPEETHTVAFLVAGAVAVMIAVAIWLISRSRSRLLRGANESAEVRARRRLEIIECATPRTFYTELHDIFVEYLESRVVTEASRRTTPELIEILGNSRLQLDWQTSIEKFLAKCDCARFSPAAIEYDPSASVKECLELINRLGTLPELSIAKRSRA